MTIRIQSTLSVGIEGIYTRTSGIYSPVLDSMSQAASWGWSVYQLSEAVTDCVDIREDGGGTTATIGFDGGYIDTAAIASHIGVNNGFSGKFYDGSGNQDATETTSGSQMQYNPSGFLNKACFEADSSQFSSYPLDSGITSIGACNLFTLIRMTTPISGSDDVCFTRAGGNNAWSYSRARGLVGSKVLGMSQGSGNDLQILEPIEWGVQTYLIEVVRDGSNNTNYLLDGVSKVESSFSNVQTIDQLWGLFDSGAFELYEQVLFPAELSSGDRTTYINHLNTDFRTSFV
mgnify:CR=1 FL=1|jgi:hypothetical protein